MKNNTILGFLFQVSILLIIAGLITYPDSLYFFKSCKTVIKKKFHFLTKMEMNKSLVQKVKNNYNTIPEWFISFLEFFLNIKPRTTELKFKDLIGDCDGKAIFGKVFGSPNYQILYVHFANGNRKEITKQILLEAILEATHSIKATAEERGYLLDLLESIHGKKEMVKA